MVLLERLNLSIYEKFGKDLGTVASLGHNEQGAADTVNGEHYRAMLNEFLFRKIEEDDNVRTDLLRTVFENRIISRNSDVNWPPRSCDLTPLDYFLWGSR